MAEELQSLLDKINREGVAKAEARKAEIISAAESRAEEIVSAARKEAEEIVSAARKEADAVSARAQDALRQAGRDILLKLRGELTDRLGSAIRDASAAALTPELMADLVKELAAAFSAKPDCVIEVRTAVRDAEALDSALRGALADSFEHKPKIFSDPGLGAGMEVSFDGGKCFFDFTLDAVAELLRAYAGEKIGDIFRAEK